MTERKAVYGGKGAFDYPEDLSDLSNFATLTGQAGKLVRVKSTEDGFELIEDSNVSLTTEAITDTGNIGAGVDIAFLDTGGTLATVTLVEANYVSGQQVVIKDRTNGATANNVTIATDGSATIDGAARS